MKSSNFMNKILVQDDKRKRDSIFVKLNIHYERIFNHIGFKSNSFPIKLIFII